MNLVAFSHRLLIFLLIKENNSLTLKSEMLIDYGKEWKINGWESMPQSSWADIMFLLGCSESRTSVSHSSFLPYNINSTGFSEVTELAEIAHEVIFY